MHSDLSVPARNQVNYRLISTGALSIATPTYRLLGIPLNHRPYLIPQPPQTATFQNTANIVCVHNRNRQQCSRPSRQILMYHWTNHDIDWLVYTALPTVGHWLMLLLIDLSARSGLILLPLTRVILFGINWFWQAVTVKAARFTPHRLFISLWVSVHDRLIHCNMLQLEICLTVVG